MPRCKPRDFDGWLHDLELIADDEGLDLLVMGWLYSPSSCCEYLETVPGLVQQLIARARWSDRVHARRDLRRVS